MSIFKESFSSNIRKQLEKRQGIMNGARTPQDMQYLNSRNSWIRMSSAVDTWSNKTITDPTLDDLKIQTNYDNTLALQYILQGGTLNTKGALKSGFGSGFDNAYSNVGSDGTAYRLGIRPMPGINGIDVKSRGAYGSLREVTVNFQCWDISQLEDLELLYMRPGYTVLVEWGWSPYFDENDKYSTIVDTYDIVNPPVKAKEQIWTDLDEKMKKNGNYEAMFGYVKNYSWNARPDGGYDCTTNIISFGEIIESLKVNYTPSGAMTSISEYGYLLKNVAPSLEKEVSIEDDMSEISGSYSQNIMAGLFYELYSIALKQDPGTEDDGKRIDLVDSAHNNTTYNLFRKTININGDTKKDNKTIGESDEQVYITLQSVCDIFNNYILLSTPTQTTSLPFAKITTLDDSYTGSIDNSISGSGDGYLLALAHPLQISIDPRVCLIKNQLWIDGINIKLISSGTDPNDKDAKPVVTFPHNLKNPDPSTFVKTLINNLVTTTYTDIKVSRPIVLKYITDYIQGPEDANGNRPNSDAQIKANLQEITKIFNELYLGLDTSTSPPKSYVISPPTKSSSWGLEYTHPDRVGKPLNTVLPTTNTFYDLLEDKEAGHLGTDNIDKAVGGKENRKDVADGDPVADEQEKIKKKQKDLADQVADAKEGLAFLDNLPLPYYISNDYKTELGIIGNIYVNLKMLYEVAIDSNIAAQDKKEKNEISLYDFFKTILSRISEAIGNVNNFDIHTSTNNVAKIIDINYVDRNSPEDVFDNAFQLEVHNLKSTVRTYKLESKIFPDQANQVAIGAQVGGGALGVDTTSLIAFNKRILDRIIPVKDAPIDTLTLANTAKEKLDALLSNLTTLYKFFARLKSGVVTDADFDVDKATDYSNALRDLINYIRTILTSKTSNKAILPTVFSVEMDGIGGLIIGNIFKVNPDILPKGYKGVKQGGTGPNLGYVVTGLGHTVKDGDWVTKIDAQTINLDSPKAEIGGADFDYKEIVINMEPKTESEVVQNTNTPTPKGGGNAAKRGGAGSPLRPASYSNLVPANTLDISQAGLNLIALSPNEGFRDKVYDDSTNKSISAYSDAKGYPTVGIGTLIDTAQEKASFAKYLKDTPNKMPYSEAEQLFKKELDKDRKNWVSKLTKPISQNMYDAMASRSYNCGAGWLTSPKYQNPTIVQLINQGEYIKASELMGKPTTSKGVVMGGLVRRRGEEKELFLSGYTGTK
jgi:GH24 family phage-related lysozyme (muramidase)